MILRLTLYFFRFENKCIQPMVFVLYYFHRHRANRPVQLLSTTHFMQAMLWLFGGTGLEKAQSAACLLCLFLKGVFKIG